MNLDDILAKAKSAPRALCEDELVFLLSLTNEAETQTLFAAARDVKLRTSGKGVNLRGIIEMSNVCAKDCFYCGIRKSNTNVARFRLDEDEILRAAQTCIDLRYGSLVLQGGEIESDAHTTFIENVLQKITRMSGGKLGITLSLGEQSEETYARWQCAGAHRYLLRIESADPELYARLHPAGHDFERRKNCLRLLRKTGYQVGSGVLIGVPGQTLPQVARDILFFAEMDLDMIGMGPYIPHRDTPLGADAALTPALAHRQLALGLNMIAVTRLLLHDVNIASTTALQALAPDGRERGVLAGANVIMPNVSDVTHRKDYRLYENKPALDENSEQSLAALVRQLASIGESINWDTRGDSPHFAMRQHA